MAERIPYINNGLGKDGFEIDYIPVLPGTPQASAVEHFQDLMQGDPGGSKNKVEPIGAGTETDEDTEKKYGERLNQALGTTIVTEARNNDANYQATMQRLKNTYNS